MTEQNKSEKTGYLPRTKEWAAFLCFAAALAVFVFFSSAVLIPHRTEYGSNWGAFLKEPRDSHQAVFFGSSTVYCNIIPAVIYENAGISSYVMAGPEQTLPMTYYYVKEMYKTQRPALVLVELTGMFYPQYTNYTKVNVGYMPWGINRLLATFFAAEPEERMGLLFPLYNYHERWSTPNFNNLRYEADELAGYTVLTDINDVEGVKERVVAFDGAVFEQNVESARKIAAICKENGSSVLFFVAPTYYPWERKYMALLEEEINAIDSAAFIDFNTRFSDLGIDEQKDFYDNLHFNIYGAEKFSAYLAGVISEYVSTDSAAYADLWNGRVSVIRDIIGE